DTSGGQGLGLLGIIGDDPGAADTEPAQDRRRAGVVPCVGRQPLFQVGIGSVHAMVLQPIGAYFGDQTGAASFVTAQVDQHATAFGRDGCSCGVQLRSAVTAQ